MAAADQGGQGSWTEPIVVESPVLVPVMSADDRARTVAILAEILGDWWMRHQRGRGATEV